jgi:peptide/nickel transport system substrate-binding protein
LAALGLSTATAVAATHRAATPQKGGTLTVFKSAEQTAGWDPAKMIPTPGNSPVPGNFALYDVLLYEQPGTLKLNYRLAQSFDTKDNVVWTVKIRPNVKFSDGTAFDAAAVQFNWQRMADPANGASQGAVARAIQSMEVTDPLTLKVTLAAPDAQFAHRVANNITWIASPTALKTKGANYATQPVGAGPFLLKEWVRDDHATFERNPTYWEKGRPYLDSIIVRQITDDQSRYNTFKTTPNSVIYLFDPTYFPTAQQDGFQLVPGQTSAGGWSMAFNVTKAPGDDVRIRQAFNLAIDRRQWNQSRRGGLDELLMTTVDVKGTAFYNAKNALPAKPDLPAAQKLIDSYVADHGGKPVQITLTDFTTPYLLLDAQVLMAQLAKLNNLQITLESAASPVVIQKYTSGNFQVYLGAPRWNEPGLDLYNYFHTGGSFNYYKYSNPQVDAQLDKLLTSTDPKVRKDVVDTVEQQLLKDVPIAWYGRFVSGTFATKSVKNYEVYFDQVPLLDDIWVSSK